MTAFPLPNYVSIGSTLVIKLPSNEMRICVSNSTCLPNRFLCLDAMRGVAAISVVLLHMYSFSNENLAPGGDLAVDFFFALSGFVIARAYKARLFSGLSVAEFCEIRIVRLYPLFILGIGLGITKEIGKIALHQAGAPTWGALVAMVVSNSLALPTPGQQFLFPLDTPDWSLFLEFIVNIFYALLLVRLPLRWIGAICFICACDLVYGAITIGNISLGPDWATLPFGLARVGFSFSVGIIFAGCWKEERRRTTFLAAVLIAVFAFFLMVGMPARVRIIYNPLVAILVFPSILWLGSIWEVPRMFRRSCGFLGDISYPLYAIHFPLLVIFARFQQRHLNSPLGPGAWGAFLVSMLIISALLVSFYDAPLRAYVSAALKLRRSAPPQSV